MFYSWEGFVDIIDTLGGVDVNVTKNFYSYAFDGGKKIYFEKGIQHLNGEEALAFVRYRKEAQGDIFRVGQQLELMKSLVEQCKQPSTLLKLPLIVPDLYKNVETNLKMKELVALAKAGMNFKDSSVITQTLPGYFLNIDGISYWGVDPEQARQVAYDLFFYGITTSQVVQATPDNMKSTSQQNQQQVAQQPQKVEKTSPPPKKEEQSVIEIPLDEEDEGNKEPSTGSGSDNGNGNGNENGNKNGNSSGNGNGTSNGNGSGEETGDDGGGNNNNNPTGGPTTQPNGSA